MAATPLLAETIDWRRLAVDGAQVVVEQVDVAARHLKRRRAVAEDPLQARRRRRRWRGRPARSYGGGRAASIASARPAAAASRWTSCWTPRAVRRPPRRLMKSGSSARLPRRVTINARSAREFGRRSGRPAPSRPSRYTTPTFDQIEVADRRTTASLSRSAGVEQEQHDRPVAVGSRGPHRRLSAGRGCRAREARNQKFWHRGMRYAGERVRRQVELAREPAPERLESAHARRPSCSARGVAASRLEREQPSSDIDRR